MFVLRKGRAQEGHRKAQEGTGRQTATSKSASCATCGKVGHLKEMCRNTNTHEIEQNEDGPSPEATVEEVWCLTVRYMVKDDHCKCTADLETSQEARKFNMNIETGQDASSWTRRSRWMNRVQLSEEGEDKERIVANALAD